MTDSLIQFQQDERGVVRLTLNDPQRFNALGEAMLMELQQVLDTVAKDSRAGGGVGCSGQGFLRGA